MGIWHLVHNNQIDNIKTNDSRLSSILKTANKGIFFFFRNCQTICNYNNYVTEVLLTSVCSIQTDGISMAPKLQLHPLPITIFGIGPLNISSIKIDNLQTKRDRS